MVGMVKRVIQGTLIVEGAGAVLYAFQFIPEYGAARGIWYSVFHAVSAFCNAGIDILGESSLAGYVDNPIINLTTMMRRFDTSRRSSGRTPDKHQNTVKKLGFFMQACLRYGKIRRADTGSVQAEPGGSDDSDVYRTPRPYDACPALCRKDPSKR